MNYRVNLYKGIEIECPEHIDKLKKIIKQEECAICREKERLLVARFIDKGIIIVCQEHGEDKTDYSKLEFKEVEIK